MHATPSPRFDTQIAPDTLQQQHDLMIELYRLDQAALLARRQERNEELRRIVQARQRVNDVLSRLAG
jgi:hypothetical protein